MVAADKNVHPVRKKPMKISNDYSSNLWRREDFLRYEVVEVIIMKKFCYIFLLFSSFPLFTSFVYLSLSISPTTTYFRPPSSFTKTKNNSNNITNKSKF